MAGNGEASLNLCLDLLIGGVGIPHQDADFHAFDGGQKKISTGEEFFFEGSLARGENFVGEELIDELRARAHEVIVTRARGGSGARHSGKTTE